MGWKVPWSRVFWWTYYLGCTQKIRKTRREIQQCSDPILTASAFCCWIQIGEKLSSQRYIVSVNRTTRYSKLIRIWRHKILIFLKLLEESGSVWRRTADFPPLAYFQHVPDGRANTWLRGIHYIPFCPCASKSLSEMHGWISNAGEAALPVDIFPEYCSNFELDVSQFAPVFRIQLWNFANDMPKNKFT